MLLLVPSLARTETLEERIPTPRGYRRVFAQEGSFASWLRRFPLLPKGSKVQLYDGREKPFQGGVHAVLDLDTGDKDLQQCADAVIRLRAEYLRAMGCESAIAFHFTNGDLARWSEWKGGARPVVHGSEVTWTHGSAPDPSYQAFRRYLDTVFTYAGSLSLARELTKVADPTTVQPGDVFVQGGSPGHAVLVMDVAEDAQGGRLFLLAQSYMPAQSVHVLRNFEGRGSPWFQARRTGELSTPEWTFLYADLRRFPHPDCGATRP